MKERTGFVSNSSSTSFICGGCGTICHGRDAYAKHHCVNNHDLCGLNKECTIEENDCDDTEDEDHNDGEYNEDGIPADQCPVCKMEVVQVKDQLKFFMKLHDLKDQKDVAKFVKEKCGTYDELKKYIEEVKLTVLGSEEYYDDDSY